MNAVASLSYSSYISSSVNVRIYIYFEGWDRNPVLSRYINMPVACETTHKDHTLGWPHRLLFVTFWLAEAVWVIGSSALSIPALQVQGKKMKKAFRVVCFLCKWYVYYVNCFPCQWYILCRLFSVWWSVLCRMFSMRMIYSVSTDIGAVIPANDVCLLVYNYYYHHHYYD